MNTLNLQLSPRWHIFIIIITFCLIINTPILGQIPETGIVVTPDTLANQAAEEILIQGGNAIDAGAAALFALSVVQPYASGIGGGGMMLIWNKQQAKATVIDFREQAPQSTDPAIFYQDSITFNIYTKYGYRSICVPGMVAGVSKALQQFGTKTLDKVLEPAIDLATNGFAVSEPLANLITEHYSRLETNHPTSSLFFPDWLPLSKGQTITRADLAHTFNLLSSNGSKVFYQGEIASAICNEINLNNGLMQVTDFQNYQPTISQPIQGKYRNLDIVTVPPPSSGGTALVELLMILEKFDLKKYELNSGQYIHLIVEAMKQVFKDRDQYFMGDPKFDRLNPQLVFSDEHIQQCVNKIDSSHVKAIPDRAPNRESSSGSQISIVDKEGNAILISATLNSYFGSAVTISQYGILLNNGMYNFSIDPSHPNSLQPGKRPQTSLAPAIVLKNNQPYLIFGGIGAERIISMLAQIIINVVDFQLPLDEAVRAPRFHYNYDDDTIEMETRIEANDIEYLKRLGHKVNLRNDFDVYFGSAGVILFDPINQQASAVNDVRQEGVAYIK